MMKRLTALLLSLLALLSGCAGGSDVPQVRTDLETPARLLAQFPPSYEISFRLEAFQGEQRSSYSHFTAVQTADGFYYAASTGEHYLFLREAADAYGFYIWDEAAGRMSAKQNVQVSKCVLEGFQDTLLHLGLLVCDREGLTEVGEASVAGRPCRIYEGAGTAGDRFYCQQTYYIDQATGLSLFHTIRYTDQTGRTFCYQMTCERFSTQQVELPETAVGL